MKNKLKLEIVVNQDAPEVPVVKYIDAICGSGKSFNLKQNIVSGDKVFKRFLLVMPTTDLCEQFRNDLKQLGVESVAIRSEKESATLQIKKALSPDYFARHIICTHEAFKHYCYQAFHNKEMQQLLSGFDIYIDEIPTATFGAYVRVKVSDAIEENFPFLAWIEERNGLYFLKKEHYDNLLCYWKENNANGKDLKHLLWVLLAGKGMLMDVDKYFFAFTANPISFASLWASEYVVMGAGISRSEFLWFAQNVLNADVMRASESLYPASERMSYPNRNVILYSLMESNASLEKLGYCFTNHLPELSRIVGKDFIYATNNDKNNSQFQCNFFGIGEKELGEKGGVRVSMCSYGMNSYQDCHKAVFLGCSNDNRDITGKWVKYCELNGWDWETVSKLRKAARNYEQCYQFVSRCSIRNFDKRQQQLYIVPDLATAEYLKEHYFKSASIECLGYDKPKEERKKVKGNETKALVQKYKAQGYKQNQVVEKTGLTKGRVSQIWK
ncbi:hypothetical protein SC127_17025 [Pantoea sp. T14]|uniref:hypothetical protein n=1 Tax=Pantoea sp. T14 TaxID=3085685 RepID=UPI002FC58E34